VKKRGNTTNNPPAQGYPVKTKVSLSLSDPLVKEIEARRGLTKRSTYIEHLITKGLETSADKRQ
jgi:metal-responsive CopG/Arc/MetJ family transcriptional regulator